MGNRTYLRTLGMAALLAVIVMSSPAVQGAAMAVSERQPDLPEATAPKSIQPSVTRGSAERQPAAADPFIIYPDAEIWD